MLATLRVTPAGIDERRRSQRREAPAEELVAVVQQLPGDAQQRAVEVQHQVARAGLLERLAQRGLAVDREQVALLGAAVDASKWRRKGAASAVTSRVRLSTAVALPVEHDPITLAKSIATLDYLSGGRVSVGVGFGWNTDELADHGVPPGRRRTMLREYLEAMRALWTQEEAAYDGEFVKFGPSWAWPKPVQSHIPVLVGAAGTEKNFKWIARSADGWITTPRDFEIDEPVQLLHDIWAAAGRDGAPRIVALDFKPAPEKLARWADLGVTEVLFGLPDRSADDVAAYVERLAGKLSNF